MTGVNFIMGYLGSGKTTFIQSYLDSGQGHGERILLIINDFGKVNYDAAVLEAGGVEVKPITYGCLCCDLRIYFRELFRECAQRNDIDRVIIEPSGIMIPDIITELFEDQEISGSLTLAPLIHIVDVRMYFRIRGKNWPPFIKKQIAVSEKIVLNRTEELGQAALDEVEKALRDINPLANYYRFSIGDNAANIMQDAAGRKSITQDFDPEAIDSSHKFKTVQITDTHDFNSKEALEKYLKSHGDKLVRAKGVVNIDGKPFIISYTPLELTVLPTSEKFDHGISMIFAL